MADPTSLPVPSNQPADLDFNAKALDQFVNGSALTFQDRFGVERKTLAGHRIGIDAAEAEIAAAVGGIDSAVLAAAASIQEKVDDVDSIVIGATQTIARNLGSYSTAPTQRPNGAPLQAGDFYFNTTENRAFNRSSGGAWVALVAADTALLATSAGAQMVGYQGGISVERALGMFDGGAVEVVGVGDSVMSGLTSPNTTTMLQYLKPNFLPLSRATFTNDGVAGSQLDSTIFGFAASGADMVVRYAANVYPKRPAATGAKRTYLIIMTGLNAYPLMQTDALLASYITAFENYCAQARADGFTVVVNTVYPRYDGSAATNYTTAKLNRLLALNDAIRRSKNIDCVVDAALQLDGLQSNTTYFIDKVHPTDAGNLLWSRAVQRALTNIGQAAPAVYPSATLKPTVSAAAQSILERASISATALNSNETGGASAPLLNAIPAIASGADFAVSWWEKRPVAPPVIQANMLYSGSTAGAFGSLYTASGADTGFIQAFVLPSTTAQRMGSRMFGGVYNHVALVRSSGTLTYYLNGVAVDSVAHTDAVASIVRLLSSTGECKLARPRMLTRASTAAEIAADFASLSEYRADETAYSFALDDGCNYAGYYVADRSPTAAHMRIVQPTKVAITVPGRRGFVKAQTVGSATFVGVPVGARIDSWLANVSVAGGGSVNLGDANGNGRFFNAALTVGQNDLTLASRYPSASATCFCNATGYTIDHTVHFTVLP